MAIVSCKAVRPVARVARRAVVASAHRIQFTGAAAAAAALLLTASPAFADYAESVSTEAELQAILAARGKALPDLESAPKVAAKATATAVLALEEERAAPSREDIRELALQEAKAVKESPSSKNARSTIQSSAAGGAQSGPNTNAIAVGALAVVAIGAAAVTYKPAEEGSTSTPAAASPVPTPAPTESSASTTEA